MAVSFAPNSFLENPSKLFEFADATCLIIILATNFEFAYNILHFYCQIFFPVPGNFIICSRGLAFLQHQLPFQCAVVVGTIGFEPPARMTKKGGGKREKERVERG